MPDRNLHDIYTLLRIGYLESDEGRTEAATLAGDRAREALDIIVHALARDLGASPRDLDGQRVSELVCRVLPARLRGNEPYARAMPDLLEAFLRHVASEEGLLPNVWEWTAAIEAGREAFAEALRDPDRPILATAPRAPEKRPAARIGRNDPCPCGSGRKYKACCLRL